jgi:methionyl-tRNA formyltransferase
MRALLFADDKYGALVANYLAERGELIGTVVHPPQRRWSGDEIIDVSPRHWQWPCSPDVVAGLERPECVVSAMFGYQITADWLALPSWGSINMHDGLLPENRGRMANAWPLFDGTPAGVTLHKMVLELDAGPILAQVEMPTFPDDTAMTVYQRQIEVAFKLFTDSWPGITEMPETPQPPGGKYHDIHQWRGLNLDDSDLPTLDKLRARTFPPLGAEFTRDGKRYRVRVEIEPIDEES